VEYDVVDEWEAITSHFQRMFGGLGAVELSEHMLSFRSLPPAVPTGLSLDRRGRLLANMPLHALESEFTTVVFDEALTSLHLKGPGRQYTYTLPSGILALRSEAN
jgi:hypothetical protein